MATSETSILLELNSYSSVVSVCPLNEISKYEFISLSVNNSLELVEGGHDIMYCRLKDR